MPRVPRAQRENRLEVVKQPFAEVSQVDFSPLIRLGGQLMKVKDTLDEAEDKIFIERKKAEIKKNFADDMSKLALDPDLESHRAKAITTVAEREVQLMKEIEKVGDKTKTAILTNYISSGANFEIAATEQSLRLRTHRAAADVETLKDEQTQFARAGTFMSDLEPNIAAVRKGVLSKQEAGLINEKEAEEELRKFTERAATAMLSEHAIASPSLFIARYAAGDYHQDNVPVKAITEARTIATNLLATREKQVTDAEKARKEVTMKLFRTQAREGALDRDAALNALAVGAIADNDFEALEVLNDRRHGTTAPPAEINQVLTRVFEAPSPSMLDRAGKELDQMIANGADRYSRPMREARRTLSAIEGALQGVNSREVSRGMQRVRLAFDKRVRVASRRGFLNEVEQSYKNRLLEDVFLADDPAAAAEKAVREIESTSGILGMGAPGAPKASGTGTPSSGTGPSIYDRYEAGGY